MIKLITNFLFASIVFSCNTPNTESDFSEGLSVEGSIERNKYAKVYLTRSLPVFEKKDSLDLIEAIETSAKVELSNDSISEILTLKRNDEYYPFLYYRSNIIKGEVNKKYKLKISSRNKIYTSITTLPNDVLLNSYSFINDAINKKHLNLNLKKKLEKSTYYKCYFKHSNSEEIFKGSPFIFNDELISDSFYDIEIKYLDKDLPKGEQNMMNVGDSIQLKLYSISKEEYTFWKSIYGDTTTFTDEISFTSQIETNIVGQNTYGYWSGQNLLTEKLIVN